MESYEQMSTWSSYPSQQLLQENWRGFLNEQTIIDHHVKILMEELDKSDKELEAGRDPEIEDIAILDSNEIKKHLESLKKEIGFGLELTGKFGGGITGLYGPLSSIIKNEGINVTEKDLVLVLLAAVTYGVTSKESKELIQALRDKDLLKPYEIGKKLISVFNKVVKSIVDVSISFADLVGYTFLFIPIINMITQIVTHNNITSANMQQLVTGVLASIASYGGKIFLQNVKDKLKDK